MDKTEKKRFLGNLRIKLWRKKKKRKDTESEESEDEFFSKKKDLIALDEEVKGRKKIKITELSGINIPSCSKPTDFSFNRKDGFSEAAYDCLYFSSDEDTKIKNYEDPGFGDDASSCVIDNEVVDTASEVSDNSADDISDNEYTQSNEEDPEETTISQLCKWAISKGISHASVDELLVILKNKISGLPATSKTLFKFSKNYEYIIESLPSSQDQTKSSEFVYFGMSEYLKQIVYVDNHQDRVLILQVFTDGLPLFRSSKIEFWPLLAKIKLPINVYQPFMVACYSGLGKPSNVALFFDKFIVELNQLLNHGITIDNEKFKVKIMCFLCDRPARAFTKQIIGHQGYYACERCVIQGIHYSDKRIYPSITDEPRSDKSFRSFENPHHHIGYSPICGVVPEVNMVKDFPLDVMHLAFLGVMKKLISECWLKGERKLTKKEQAILNERLQSLSKQITAEFQRTTRSLQLVELWKAVEFRLFCLYLGFFIMKDLLSEKLLEHFLQFCIALRILHDESLVHSHTQIARELLISFVKNYGEQDYYGLESMVLNIHSLIHLADDVEHFQCSLSQFNAFACENELKNVKRCLRQGNKPLQQLCRREAEKRSLQKKVIFCKNKITVKSTKSGTIKEVKTGSFLVKPKSPNNVLQLVDSTFIKVSKIVKINKALFLEGNSVKILGPAFKYPSPKICEDLQIYTVDEKEETPIFNINFNQVKRKAAIFKVIGLEPVIMPLLHL